MFGPLQPVKIFRSLAILLTFGVVSAAAGPADVILQPSPTPADETHRNLFSYETTYTFDSDFKESKLGDGSSLYDDFSYDHRFLISGKVFFRLGVEYERYDFGGTNNGLPDHLQGLYGHVAVEYVVKDYPGAAIELEPGVYFQDHIRGNTSHVPRSGFFCFSLRKDKVLPTIVIGWAQFQDPGVAHDGVST